MQIYSSAKGSVGPFLFAPAAHHATRVFAPVLDLNWRRNQTIIIILNTHSSVLSPVAVVSRHNEYSNRNYTVLNMNVTIIIIQFTFYRVLWNRLSSLPPPPPPPILPHADNMVYYYEVHIIILLQYTRTRRAHSRTVPATHAHSVRFDQSPG